MGNGGAVAHALAGLGTSLAEAALVLLLLLLVCLRLLLLLGGGWWGTGLVEAWASGHGGLLDWGASCGGGGGVLAGGEAVEALGGLGLPLC